MPSIINSDDGVVSGTSGLKSTGGNDGLLNIQTNGSNAISISAGQRSTFPTTIGVGGATPSTSGSGISFPATQSASSDANTLDDYEEGTWTPTLGGTGGNPTGVTYNAQLGTYTKIGRQVTITFQLSFSTYTGGSGNVKINGLPFTSIAGYLQFGAAAIENVTLSAGRTATVSAISTGATFIAVYQYGSNVAYIDIPFGGIASSGTTKYLDGEITYFV